MMANVDGVVFKSALILLILLADCRVNYAEDSATAVRVRRQSDPLKKSAAESPPVDTSQTVANQKPPLNENKTSAAKQKLLNENLTADSGNGTASTTTTTTVDPLSAAINIDTVEQPESELNATLQNYNITKRHKNS